MTDRNADQVFAEEVYASCATIGYSSETVRALKALLDRENGSTRDGKLIELALRAQAEAAQWAAR